MAGPWSSKSFGMAQFLLCIARGMRYRGRTMATWQNLVPTTVKRMLPSYVKHPLWASTRWYWQMRGLPAQSMTDISIFKEVLSKVESPRLRIFEWGSGSSTVYYPEFLRSIRRQFDWSAADNSQEWFKGQEKIAKPV